MTKLILSTSNVMNGGSSVIRRNGSEKSNEELTTSLRSNILAAQEDSYEAADTNGTSLNGDGPVQVNGYPTRPPLSSWTTREEPSTLYIPSIDWSLSGLAEERSQYDLTVKLFYLPGIPAERRCVQTQEAIQLVLKELNMPSVDLLIASFPGVAFCADEEEKGEQVQVAPCGGVESTSTSSAASEDSESSHDDEAEDIESIARTWRSLETLQANGTVGKLGVSEFGSKRLQQLLDRVKVRPAVDQINVRDCCVVPRPLISYAHGEGIELLTHNECTNILPRGTVRELLGPGEQGAGVLAGLPEGQNGSMTPNGLLKGDVEPQYVVKYTAVVRNRGVVENKGYFAMAELND
ncbi:MAG: hypothetical protein M4579_002085 [Chaenotheca gracillima]|nr:MAG: hypothetical protein M4579_002085 [Chaenotheca gracillima]